MKTHDHHAKSVPDQSRAGTVALPEIPISRRTALRRSASAGIVVITAAWLAQKARASSPLKPGVSADANDAVGSEPGTCDCICTVCSCECAGECNCGTCVNCYCPYECACDPAHDAVSYGIVDDATTSASNTNSLAVGDQASELDNHKTNSRDSAKASTSAEDSGIALREAATKDGWVAGVGPAFEPKSI